MSVKSSRMKSTSGRARSVYFGMACVLIAAFALLSSGCFIVINGDPPIDVNLGPDLENWTTASAAFSSGREKLAAAETAIIAAVATGTQAWLTDKPKLARQMLVDIEQRRKELL